MHMYMTHSYICEQQAAIAQKETLAIVLIGPYPSWIEFL